MDTEILNKLTNILRYDLERGRGYDADFSMVESTDGEWVKIEDLAEALGLWYGYVRAEGYRLRLEKPVYDD